MLVSAASMHGSTIEITHAIAAEPCGPGFTAAVIPPGEVCTADGYDAAWALPLTPAHARAQANPDP
jgi:hypothetical protein